MVPRQCCAPHCSVSVVFPEHGAPPFVGGIHPRVRFRWPSQVAEQCPQGSQSLSTPSTVDLLTIQHGLLMLLFNIYYFGNNQISKGKLFSSCQTMYARTWAPIPGQCCAPHRSVSIVFPEHGAPPFVGGIHARVRFRWPSQEAVQCPQGSQSLSTPSTVVTVMHRVIQAKGWVLESQQRHIYIDKVVNGTSISDSFAKRVSHGTSFTMTLTQTIIATITMSCKLKTPRWFLSFSRVPSII